MKNEIYYDENEKLWITKTTFKNGKTITSQSVNKPKIISNPRTESSRNNQKPQTESDFFKQQSYKPHPQTQTRTNIPSLSQVSNLNWKNLFDVLYERPDITSEAIFTVFKQAISQATTHYVERENNIKNTRRQKKSDSYARQIQKIYADKIKTASMIKKPFLPTEFPINLSKKECLVHIVEYLDSALETKKKVGLLHFSSGTNQKSHAFNVFSEVFLALYNLGNPSNAITIESIRENRNSEYLINNFILSQGGISLKLGV